jgi:hypothetical protein
MVADDFIAKAWIPEVKLLGELKTALVVPTNRFREIYQPIRTQIFAHKLLSNDQTEWELFQKTNREELRGMLVLLRDVMDAIHEAYMNGTKPELGTRQYGGYRQAAEDSAKRVLNKLSKDEG